VKNTAHNILLSNCETLRESISVCQGLGKKILLSLGGASNTYQLTSNADATATADFLWGAFGPGNAKWDNPRPFDYLGKYTVIDGFDFDIEHTVSGFTS
jgi:chitinase